MTIGVYIAPRRAALVCQGRGARPCDAVLKYTDFAICCFSLNVAESYGEVFLQTVREPVLKAELAKTQLGAWCVGPSPVTEKSEHSKTS